jgi:hypothetical protein
MSKKARPRWGENGVVETQEFALTPDQMSAISATLGLSENDDLSSLEWDLEYLASLYLQWKAHDEKGPSRAERNAALKETLKASERLGAMLCSLDGASEAELIDALLSYKTASSGSTAPGDVASNHQPQELGFRQLQSLRDRLNHFNVNLSTFLKDRMQQRGPDARKSLPAIVGYLSQVYERETGKAVTHNPYKSVEDYSGVPQSQAGKFMAAFFECVDPDLPATAVATELRRQIKRTKASRRQTS